MKVHRLIIALALALAPLAVAQIATDNASNYGGANPAWTSSSNQGTGFGAWNLYTDISGGGSAGFFLASSSAQGFGDVNTGGQAFGMFGNPSGNNYSNAERAFSASLGVGQAFSMDLAIAYRNGSKGVVLFAGGFNPVNEIWNFNVASDEYRAGGVVQSWAYSQTSVFHLTATQTSATNVKIDLVRGSDSYTTNITVATALSGFRSYVGSTDAGDLNNLFTNNLSIVAVPEPSTFTLLGLGLVALALRRKRKVS